MIYLFLLVYNVLLPLGFVLYFPAYWWRLHKRGNWRLGFGERFGLYTPAKRAQLAALTRPVWIHAVSVGEVKAALLLIRAWQARTPGQQFVLTSTTSTGQQLARDKGPAGLVTLYFPLDWWPCVALTLRAIRPALLVIFEHEFWPTLSFTAARRGLPQVLVNGLISDRSAPRYARLRALFGPVMRHFAQVCVQSPVDAERIAAIAPGHPQVHVCGTMKFDEVPDPKAGTGAPWLARAFPDPQRVLFCAASTHGGEEEVVLGSFLALRAEFPHLRLVLVPRHHERSGDLEALLRARQVPYLLRSTLRDPAAPVPPETQVLVVNSTGELMDVLAVADLVFVGKSLAGNTGGHNVIEPAIFAKPILVGPHTENFREVVAFFRAQHALLEVADEAAMTAALRPLFADPTARQQLGQRARATVDQQRGAIARTLAYVAPLVRG